MQNKKENKIKNSNKTKIILQLSVFVQPALESLQVRPAVKGEPIWTFHRLNDFPAIQSIRGTKK